MKVQNKKTVKKKTEGLDVFGSYQKWYGNVVRRRTLKTMHKEQKFAAKKKKKKGSEIITFLKFLLLHRSSFFYELHFSTFTFTKAL